MSQERLPIKGVSKIHESWLALRLDFPATVKTVRVASNE
jgi:hypothetical protein